MMRSKTLAKREIHVLEIGACAVKEDDREKILRAASSPISITC